MKEALEALRLRYEEQGSLALAQDPLSLALAYPDALDREVAAFVAATLAYGRVGPMLRAIRGVLEPLGPRPSDALRGTEERVLARRLGGALEHWVWRFHTGADLVAWLLAWKCLDAESGAGLEAHLAPEGAGQDPDLRLSALVGRLRRELPESPGLRFSLTDPASGSACKRWRMFLRWMVRRGWPDLGQWTTLSPAGLVIPLDTHVARVSRLLGLSRRRSPDGRMALEVTEALRAFCPEDPLRYDFALSHLGIQGDCPGRPGGPACLGCPLEGLCQGEGKERGKNQGKERGRDQGKERGRVPGAGRRTGA